MEAVFPVSAAFDLGGWGPIVLGFVTLAAGVTRFVVRADEPRGERETIVRGFFLVWLAACVSLSVLFAVAGLTGPVYEEDIVLLAVCWSVLVLIWLADLAAISFLRRRRDA